MNTSPWIAHRVAAPRARVRLFCFPHAGGGASSFAGWRRFLPEWVELCPIEPPGRWTRLHEEPLRRIEAIADALGDALVPLLDLPYVLLGHSMGAMAVFETARRLAERRRPPPAHLVVAARGAPHSRRHAEPLYQLPDDELLHRLEELYGAERMRLMANPEVRALFLPALRCDLEALETYAYTGTGALTAPIAAFGGRADPTLCEQSLAAWGDQTQGIFSWTVLDGDHFFIHDANSGFLAHLNPLLEHVASH